MPTRAYDVIIVGGALAGGATALQLLHQSPELRVLIVERSEKFGRRVGEATVEVSAYFLGRTLGLTQHLNEQHLSKQGLRFWFANKSARTLDQCSEIGGRYLVRVPSYQIDRAVLDEEVLKRAVEAGAALLRPARVQQIDLNTGGLQRVQITQDEVSAIYESRWVIDASGVSATLARQQGWWRPNLEHPTASVWSRWKGVKDWDGRELAQRYPEWAKACYGTRGTATNHIVGPGWWAWCIPLKGGDVSIGVVFDQRLVSWPNDGTVAERLKTFLVQHPVFAELLADAHCTPGDVHLRRNLPYYSTTFCGDGFALVGDAAGFIDPFYSPGMDWIAYTTASVTHLILEERAGKPIERAVSSLNERLTNSYKRWFEALYLDKYEYIGEFDLMRLAFLLDVGFYYFGVASQPFKRGAIAFQEPSFSTRPSIPFYHFMALYNRRFAAMGRDRRERGVENAMNAGQRFMFGGFTFSLRSAGPLVGAVLAWAVLEVREGWRTWFKVAQPSPNRILARPVRVTSEPAAMEIKK